MLHGSINHVGIVVSDLPEAMRFFGPMLRFLGYEVGAVTHYAPAGTQLVVSLNPRNEIAFNIWQAKPGLREHRFAIYEPGLHHVAFNVGSHAQVEEAARLVVELGGEVMDGPAEFPFGIGGYYALYVRGPDGLKLELVHQPALEQLFRERGIL
jgi:catechol 2,3-dioxygenase-like lactoylglutathione lyase family enzyme